MHLELWIEYEDGVISKRPINWPTDIATCMPVKCVSIVEVKQASPVHSIRYDEDLEALAEVEALEPDRLS